MGTLYLVRHGQARFGTDDYDRLSPLGEQQCAALGEWFAARGVRFEAVLCGTLTRHRQSLRAIAGRLSSLPEALEWPGLNEYDAEAVVASVADAALKPSHDPETVRQHFRWLRQGLLAWMAGTHAPAGMPTWPAFQAGVVGALDHVRTRCAGDVLLVSSGGPIATAIGHVMDVPAATVVELNMRLRNSAVSELTFTPKRHALLSFNSLAHLDAPGREGWRTYA